MPEHATNEMRQQIEAWFYLMAACEGRLAAMRWLIEFIGVGDCIDGKVHPPKRKPKDISIEMIEGGEPIDRNSHEAEYLSKVWKACAQASLHPTQDTNHFSVDTAPLDKALRIVVKHLQRTIYSHSNRNLVTETFRASN